ncbi:MAG: hypothetical protein O2854_08070 [Chloroflexi bacterium]|nr:hypothetical protein [Chloroflexota bacterium]
MPKTAPKKKAASKLTGKAQTVLGPIDAADLGITLGHEHLLIDRSEYFVMPDEASKRHYIDKPLTMDIYGKHGVIGTFNMDIFHLLDTNAAIREVLKYKHAGGASLVDTTSIGIARDPLALARISRATGLNVIMGCSYYVPASYPPGTDEKSEDQFAEEIIRDITVGVGDTGVKAGVIGEIGCYYPLEDTTKRVIRGSVAASLATGCPITIHPGLSDRSPAEILNIIIKAGGDPKNVVIGHISSIMNDYAVLKDLAQTGCFIQDDLFAMEDTSIEYLDKTDLMQSDVQRIERIQFLVDEGHLSQLLVGQDVCMPWQHSARGGKGFAHILENIVPRLRKRGFTQKQLDAILIDNPRRAFAFR